MQKKKSRVGKAAAGGAIIAALVYLIGSGTGEGLLKQTGIIPSQTSTTIASEEQSDQTTEVTVVIEDDKLTLNGTAVTLEQLGAQLTGGQHVLLKSQNAKQLTYDAVKSLLQQKDCVIIEE